MAEEFDELPSPYEYDDEEEVEEIEEIEESELLRYLDRMESPYAVVSRLFKSDFDHFQLSLLSEQQVNMLLNRGFIIVDGLAKLETISGIHKETLELVSAGKLQKAHVFDEEDPGRDLQTRDDLTLMLQPKTMCEMGGSFCEYADLIDAIKRDLALAIAINTQFVEYQLAYYPGAEIAGARYERHRDSFPCDGSDADHQLRKVTAITYVGGSSEWCPEHGGCLKLYYQQYVADPASDPVNCEFEDSQEELTLMVEPKRGRTVIFLSGLIDHEVLPVFHDHRVALTAWIH